MFRDLIVMLERFLGNSTSAYCDLETAKNATTLVDDQGGYLSILQLDGSREIFDTATLSQVADHLAASLSQILRSRAHQIDVIHHHEPYESASSGGQINFLLDGQRHAARQMGLDMKRLIDSQADVMARFCHEEQTLLIVRTHADALAKEDRKRAQQKHQQKIQGMRSAMEKGDPPMPSDADGVQNHVAGLDALLSIHESAVEGVRTAFDRLGYFMTRLTVHEALSISRRRICPERTPAVWKPQLPGDRMHIRVPQSGADIRPADVLAPSLAQQMFPRSLVSEDGRHLRVGDRVYRGISMNLPPSELEGFGRLLASIMRADAHMPFRMSWRLFGGGLEYDGLRDVLLAFLRFVPGPNRRIADALEALKDRFKENEAIVGLSVDAITWVDGSDYELLETRLNTLSRVLESWGGSQVSDNVGDPAESWAATIPALKRISPSPMAAAPASDAFLMTPLTRSSSPWKTPANCLFRTPDGKLWPYRAYSPQQNAWISLVYAPMGYGKSVMLNALNRGLVLDPENTELPLVRLLDVGNSSSGFINLVKYSLPANKRHYAGYFKMTNSREAAMNPCDLPLGLHKPLHSHQSFLVDLLSTLCTPLDSDAPPHGVEGVLQRIVDIAYEAAWETSPKSYAHATEPVVDEAIATNRIHIDERSTWYEVRDALFEVGDIHAATLAQRCAVPTIADISGAAMDESIRSAFGEKMIDGEPMNAFVHRTLSTALGLYPILSDRTRFDFGDARIVSLDLQEVALSGTKQADRQTAVMYMLAMRALVADFAFREDDASYIPEGYRAHFLRIVERTNRVPKRFGADEFHRTAPAPTARSGIVTLIREGRKWRLETILASQMLSDFDGPMQNLATSVFVLGCGNNAAKQTAETFDLGEAGRTMCSTQLNGPGPGGSNFIGVFHTKKASHIALLTLSLSPMELWAYNTTAQDRQIRDALYKAVPVMDALELLADRFPKGSATDEIERIVNLRIAQGIGSEEDGDGNVVQHLIEELLDRYAKRVQGTREREAA